MNTRVNRSVVAVLKKNKASPLYILYGLRSFDRLTRICWTRLFQSLKTTFPFCLFCLLSDPKHFKETLLQSSIKLFKLLQRETGIPLFIFLFPLHTVSHPSVDISSKSSGLRDIVSAFLSFLSSQFFRFFLTLRYKDGSTRNVGLATGRRQATINPTKSTKTNDGSLVQIVS